MAAISVSKDCARLTVSVWVGSELREGELGGEVIGEPGNTGETETLENKDAAEAKEERTKGIQVSEKVDLLDSSSVVSTGISGS